MVFGRGFNSRRLHFYVVLLIGVTGSSPSRLHNVSKTRGIFLPFEQPDCRVYGCWRQVHVALCRGQVGVPGEHLDGAHRPSLHRKMRAETVPEDVHALPRKVGATRRPADEVLHNLLGQRTAICFTQHSPPTQVTQRL